MQQILAIDDSPDIHQLLSVRLGGLNVELRHALTGESGYEQACEEPPDLILLDVMMPDASGFEICRRLKARSKTASIPVIFLTGETDVEQKVLGFDVGAVDYIQKPFDTAELTARVRSALRTKRYFDMLAHRAMLDGLTGLWNRSQFDQRLYEEIASARRYDRPLSLVMMDIDRFKNLNDTYGHPFGDQVLQSVGELLQGWKRSTDLPCRYGGEEFGIILRETDMEGAERTAERIRGALEELEIRHRSNIVSVTASFGVSSMSLCRNPCELDHNWLIASADSALYRAKEAGRNCVSTGIVE
ncbi:MAG: diguanylate cyclase [Planctomycetota bacterium]|nr:diguanylate cyclase [Planctomycetota bacterium]MDA1249883.1 diguanylate cyclase [Planctomycetota bacterium]